MKVSETIIFPVGELKETFAKNLREKIDSFPNAEEFRGVYIFSVENTADGHNYSDCYGVDMALNILRKDPSAKIVMYAFLGENAIRKMKPSLDIVLKHENVYLVGAPFTSETLQNVFQSKREYAVDLGAVTKEVQHYIVEILHALNYVKDWEHPQPHEESSIERGVKLAKKYFPDLSEKSNTEIFSFLRSVSTDREEVMKGKEVNGVFCDIEGTILIDGKPNAEVLTLLEKYNNEGKTITLWTDGNLEELSKSLKRVKVQYPLVSKLNYAGAVAEIVIDDMDEYSFTALTKITAKKFIRASDV